MLTKNQQQILEKAVEKGGVTQKMLKDVYQHKSSISDTVQKMVNRGFLEEKPAPGYDSARKVYFPTEKAEVMVET